MRKSELKPGMVVKYRDGELRVLDNDENLSKFYKEKGRLVKYGKLTNYTEDLKNPTCKDVDIVAVYQDLRIYYDNKMDPIWEEDLMQHLQMDDLVWIKANKSDDWALRFLYKYNKDVKIAEVFNNGYNSKSQLNFEKPITTCFKYCRPYTPGEVI